MLGCVLDALINLIAAPYDTHHLRRKGPPVVISDQDDQRFGPFVLFPDTRTPPCIKSFGLHPAIHFRRTGFDLPDINIQGLHIGKTHIIKLEFQCFFPDRFF